jgi:hypothetical protein
MTENSYLFGSPAKYSAVDVNETSIFNEIYKDEGGNDQLVSIPLVLPANGTSEASSDSDGNSRDLLPSMYGAVVYIQDHEYESLLNSSKKKKKHKVVFGIQNEDENEPLPTLSLDEIHFLPDVPAEAGAVAILPRLPSVREEDIDYPDECSYNNDENITIVPQPQLQEGEEVLLMPRLPEAYEEVVFLPRLPSIHEHVIMLPKTPSMMDEMPPVFPVDDHTFSWRLKLGLTKCLTDAYFISSFTYVIYTIQALMIDFCDDVAIFEHQCDDKVLNVQYVILASLHVFNAFQYFAAWIPWMKMNEKAAWALKLIFIFPEFLNIIEGSLYLYSATTYQSIADSQRCSIDVHCPKSMRMHYIESVAASIECVASCFWVYAWYYIFRLENEGLRKRDKLKILLCDPEFYSVAALVAASVLYIWYYEQVDRHPRKFGRSVLNEKGDVIYFLGALCFLISSMKICGVFFFVHLPGWDEGKEAQDAEDEEEEEEEVEEETVVRQLFDVEMTELGELPPLKPIIKSAAPKKDESTELVFNTTKNKKKAKNGSKKSSENKPLLETMPETDEVDSPPGMPLPLLL